MCAQLLIQKVLIQALRTAPKLTMSADGPTRPTNSVAPDVSFVC